VMNHMLDRKGEVRASTLSRAAVAFGSKPFDIIRNKRLVETVSEDLLRVLKAGGVSTNVWLRVLHNTALKLDWLLRRVLAEAAWPKVRYGVTRAITAEEHGKIIAKERDDERKRFYQTLWHTGAAPVDIANLTHENVNWEKKVLQFFRQKLNCKGRLKSEAGGAEWRGGPKVRHPEINMEDVHRYGAMDRNTTPGVG